MKRTEKEATVSTIRESFDRSSLSVVAEYKGLTVAQLTDLRTQLRKVDGRFRVVKNTLARKALTDHSAAPLAPHLKGAVGVVFGYGDPAATAKVVKDFGKQAEPFKVAVGVFEGQLLDARQLGDIADLPSREVLIARLLGAMNSPITGIVNVLAGPPRKLVYALAAIARQKEAA